MGKFSLILGFVLVGTLAFSQSVQLKDFIIESPSPVWGDLFVFPESLAHWSLVSRPSLGDGGGILTLEYIRGALEIPIPGVIQGKRAIYLPSHGYMNHEKRLLYLVLQRIGEQMEGRGVLILDRVSPITSETLDPRWSPDKLPQNGHITWEISLEVGTFNIEGRLLNQVPVLARDVVAGDQLGPSDFRLEYRLQDSSWEEDLQGFYTARADFHAGRMLSSAVLNPFYHVKTGESIRVIVRKGALEVRMEGTSLENGNPGEEIRIRSGWDSSEYMGEILRTQEVLVEIP